jgi:hypothetical protein
LPKLATIAEALSKLQGVNSSRRKSPSETDGAEKLLPTLSEFAALKY